MEVLVSDDDGELFDFASDGNKATSVELLARGDAECRTLGSLLVQAGTRLLKMSARKPKEAPIDDPETLTCEYCERVFPKTAEHLELRLVFDASDNEEPHGVVCCREECLVALMTSYLADRAAAEFAREAEESAN